MTPAASHRGVVGIFRAAAAGEPMESREEAVLRPGRGIPDDRYARGRGHWSRHRHDDVTLVAAEEVEAASRILGVPLDPADLRRNVVVRGVDLDDLVGRRFLMGEAELHGVRPCDPCRYLEELLGVPGLKAALRGRGGLRASVLEAGRVRIGDAVTAQGREDRDGTTY